MIQYSKGGGGGLTWTRILKDLLGPFAYRLASTLPLPLHPSLLFPAVLCEFPPLKLWLACTRVVSPRLSTLQSHLQEQWVPGPTVAGLLVPLFSFHVDNLHFDPTASLLHARPHWRGSHAGMLPPTLDPLRPDPHHTPFRRLCIRASGSLALGCLVSDLLFSFPNFWFEG